VGAMNTAAIRQSRPSIRWVGESEPVTGGVCRTAGGRGWAVVAVPGVTA
jgi:hypothetical protein